MKKTKSRKKVIYLRPSNASYWTNCPGYLHFKTGKDIFDNRNRSEVGTIAHTFLEKLVENYNKTGQWKKGFSEQVFRLIEKNHEFSQREKKLISEEYTTIRRYVLMAFNKISRDMVHLTELWGEENVKIYTEFFIEYSGQGYVLKGTLDIVIQSPEDLYVYDLKTGIIEVEAEDNAQLTEYAHLASWFFSKIIIYETVTVSIIQPSTNTISTETIDIDPEHFIKIAEHIKKKDCVTGSHCKYCEYGIACKELGKVIRAFSNTTLPDNSKINKFEEFSKLLEMAPVIEKLIEQIKEKSKQYIEQGSPIPGWTIYKKNTQRRWISGISATEVAKLLKLKKSDITEEKLKTPKTIEAMVSSNKLDEFNSLFMQGTAIVLKKIK